MLAGGAEQLLSSQKFSAVARNPDCGWIAHFYHALLPEIQGSGSDARSRSRTCGPSLNP